MEIHVRTEGLAITTRELSPVTALMDGQERSVKWVSLSLNGMGGRCQLNTLLFSIRRNDKEIEQKNKYVEVFCFK